MSVTVLRQLFAPLTLALQSRAAARALIEDLGWSTDEQFDLGALSILDPVADDLTSLIELAIAVEAGTREPGAAMEEAVLFAQTLFTAIEDLQDLAAGDIANLAAPMNTRAFWAEFALDLPEYLIVTYLQTYLPLVFALLDLGGAIGTEARPDERTPRRTVDWHALGALFTNPSEQLQTTYKWGGPLEHAVLIPRLRALIWALGLKVETRDVPGGIAANRFSPQAGASGVNTLKSPILDIPAEMGSTAATGSVKAAVIPVPRTGRDPTGLLLTLEILGQVEHTIVLGGGWSVVAETAADASGILGIEAQPEGISLPSGLPQGSAALTLSATPAEPMLLFGSPGGTRVVLGRFEAGGSVHLSTAAADFGIDVTLSGLELIITPGDGDGFISDILGETEFVIPMEFGIDWSKSDGLRISGGAGFDFEILINKTIGPLAIDSVSIRLIAGFTGGEMTAATSGSFVLGPFVATVEQIGFRITLEPVPRGDRNGQGAVVVRAAFKPPDGIGLGVDAAGIGGGGYLELFPDEGRYNGIVHLNLFGLEITAIGLIATQMPDGSGGWSMFLSISVRFGAGIQLAFGFKLTGVGGLAGVHRGIDIEAMGDAVRAGNLDAVLFPDDPIANAATIINTLDTIFPVQLGQYVFGPVFEIGWGTPTIVTIELGLAIQLPSPLTISLLGSIGILIGQDDVSLIDIKVDIVGTLWPTEGRIAIDSSISRGKIAFLNLSGDMSLRGDLGASNPSLLLAAGGFHPHFEQPEGFPTLRRLSLRIFDEEDLRIGVEAYLALGSNALQFGAAAYFYGKALGFVAEGRFEFDTLIIIKPFGLTASLGFMADISAGSVNLLSVRLRGTLRGPQPWIVDGYAEFRAFGTKQEFSIEMTLGASLANPPRPVADLFDTMLAELRSAEAWTAAPVDPAIEALVAVDVPGEGLYVHPVGRVRVKQTLAPLNLRIDKLGEEVLRESEARIEMTLPLLDGDTALVEPEKDWFAPAQYFDMDEEEKITAPSFEELDAGLLIGEAFTHFEPSDPFEMSYETKYRDPDADAAFPGRSDLRTSFEDARDRFVADADPPPVFSMTPRALRGGLAETGGRRAQFSVNAPAHTTKDARAVHDSWSAARADGGAGAIRPAYERHLEGT